MTDKDPSQDILNKIKDEKITPKSYFQVHWKGYVFWLAWGAIMLFGAISFSLLLLNVLDIRPDFLHELGLGRYLWLLARTTPFLWLGLVAIALSTGYIAMRRTRTGYRYSMLFITSIIVLFISVVGMFLHFSKFNQRIGERMMHDERLQELGLPVHKRLSRPDDGMLGGRITSIADNGITIENPRGKEWVVTYDSETKIEVKDELHTDMFIMLAGEKVEKGMFHADVIRALPPHLEFEKNGPPRKGPPAGDGPRPPE
jgi:hypothetical protein